MGIAENKAIVLEFMQRLGSADPAWDLLADDASWWMQGLRTVTKAEFQQVAAGMKGQATKSEMFIDHVTAEDDRVAVESHSRIEIAGRDEPFQNVYHFLFHLKDGKIVKAREHFDTAYARDYFGRDTQEAVTGG